ncbi:MAG TPA: hypothetical protein VNN10_11100 [Dehalococcoidia bacterium]|nr:hypothetical protein [Dehalococcoidia bacterium]
MSELIEKLRNSPSRRNPPYRPLARIDDAEREALKRKIGGVENYNGQAMRELVQAAPDNLELRKAMVSSIMSAEFAGIDAFSRKVVEWQEWDVPESLILAMARQTWDEVRHAQLSKGVLESYGGVVGEYPDTLAGGQGGGGGQAQAAAPAPANGGQANGGRAQGQAVAQAALGEAFMRNPIASLSMTNVSLEGGALTLFKGTSELGRKIGDHLMEHCYDYNWADEVTHVAIGDYFVKKLTEGDPQKERFALMAHARHEMMRGNLTPAQAEELKAFFAEEMERAGEALVSEQPAAGGYR